MLLSLHIENIAVIKTVDIDFTDGFTVMTGETGAGKSIIIDSLCLILGAKADKDIIRKGESYCMVSGVFSELSDKSLAALSELGISPDEDGRLVIQRTVGADGRSAVKINGRGFNLSVLKNVSAGLINIHGQSDTGALLDSARHLELVDIYADNSALLAEYSEVYSELEAVRHKIEELLIKDNEAERLKEILEYQIKDIDSLKLHDGEEEELIEKKLKVKNSEKITKNTEFVYKALRGSEKGSISLLLDKSISALNQISGILPQLAEYAERLREMTYSVNDIAEEVYAVLEDADRDPTETLNRIESRLDKISRMKRKYGLTVADVLQFRDNAKAELDSLENCAELIEQYRLTERRLYKEALAIADRLHEIRATKAAELENKVRQTLEFLDMPKVVFFASIKEEYKNGEKLLNKSGSDFIEFYISANKGADAQPISRIASGGELARIMLALKSVIADKDRVSTIVFDEIDAGVSGKTARKIGIKMRSLAQGAQIFCVTHSAQIASLGHMHFLISKSEVNGATETAVTSLDYDGRVRELSRILGGINVTDSQRAAAVDMLGEVDN